MHRTIVYWDIQEYAHGRMIFDILTCFGIWFISTVGIKINDFLYKHFPPVSSK